MSLNLILPSSTACTEQANGSINAAFQGGIDLGIYRRKCTIIASTESTVSLNVCKQNIAPFNVYNNTMFYLP